jgi:SAM-dependent methyltransferase
VHNKDKVRRTAEQLRNHFEVERELASRVLNASRDERRIILPTLYDELFARVPDHPRLTRQITPEMRAVAIESRLRILRPHLSKGMHFLEFAPGDCALSHAVCPLVKSVTAVDISDQRSLGASQPENFNLILYDGYELDLAESSVDMAFSYQFLEHLHPEDVGIHLRNAARVLKEGGVYIFDTPHRFSGPHDISSAFGNELKCLHFQEWTYREMFELLRQHGFGSCFSYAGGKVRKSYLINFLKLSVERIIGMLPCRWTRTCSERIFQGVTVMAVKG